ncbi:unnamed protein product [Brassica rapa]|uniref:Reverse transcriptase zinc-binding domain-containing protein n=1 Tax=Brassica campestris TaxID=3711 RepID=A0A3P6B543_BRACM|nr:unnamed protein product [Brassica rapa]VDC96179.1 unnamed protein product [Brassica rapa]
MIETKSMLVDFLKCKVGNGQDAMFWFDSWSDLGPLIDFIGATGPRQLRIRLSASVTDATSNGEWHLPSARSPQAEALQIHLTTNSHHLSLEVRISSFGFKQTVLLGPLSLLE